MLGVERQSIIKSILLEKRSVTVAELSERFDVSFETIRRDFKVLEADGFIEKTYGCATLRERVGNTADFKALEHVLLSTKEQMAAIAKHFIVPGDCIYIDFSSTCLNIARVLGDFSLNVMSNSLEVLNVLSEKQNVTLFATAGFWDVKNHSFMGRSALESLSQYRFDKAFISCRAISMDNGISDKNEQEADIRQRIIESANEVYLLADHTKFDKTAFVRTSGFDHISALITDQTLSAQWQDFLQENGIRYYDFTTDFAEQETE